MSHIRHAFVSNLNIHEYFQRGNRPITEYQWQTYGANRQPRYVHVFTCTKSCSLDSRRTLPDNDNDTVGVELRASEIGFPPAVQRLADVASTLLLPDVLTAKDAGTFGLYS